MAVFLVGWGIFLSVLFMFRKVSSENIFLYLSGLFLLMVPLTSFFNKNLEIFFMLFFYLMIFLYFNNNRKKLKNYVSIIYLILAFGGLLFFLANKNVSWIVPVSALFLVLREYDSRKEAFLWIFSIILIITGFFIGKDIFYISHITLIFPILSQVINSYKKEIERDKNIYKSIYDGAINTELQKYYEEINDQLSITYKRLREIFKLSNKTIKPIDIEEILNNVINGLLDLGYTGILVAIDYKNIHLYKKGGFFPSVEKLINEKLPEISEIEISEDEKTVFIPLLSDQGKIGVLSVYKKNLISPSEIEYLRTYANSVAISIAKTVYFKELGYLENILGKMFESIDIGIVILDESLNIETANHAMKKMFGRKPEGKFFEIYTELDSLKERIKEVIETRKSIDITISPVERKGKTYRVKLVPLFISKKNHRIVLLVEDITEKVKLEAQLIETEKHAVVGKLAAGLSHDIKNPLSAISASAFTIKKKLKDNPLIVKLAENIEKNSARAVDIVDKLLNYAKPSYYKKQKTDLKNIVELSVEFAIPPSKRKSINIHKNLKDGVYVFADKNSLQQVFINLIMNAVEAINGDGDIYISLDKNGDFAEVKIKDTGKGIPEDILDNIFEPFFTTKEKGTGLGLSVVSKIIKDHSGYIDVKSKREEGTEFIVNLPLYTDGGIKDEK